MVEDNQSPDLTQSLFAGIARDVIYSVAGAAAAHGYITQSQTEAFVGAGFFFAMLAFNSIRRAISNAQIKEATK